jgi:hypothetical protein
MMLNTKIAMTALVGTLLLSIPPYPIDGYEESCIRRLQRIQLTIDGGTKDAKPIEGAMLSIKDIKLNLTGTKGDSLKAIPAADPEFQRAINSLFPNLHESYSLAVLDMTPGKRIRYASRKETGQFQPGSVGKLAVAVAFFTEIRKIYPDNFVKAQELMKSRMVRAGKWALTDTHTVPFYNPDTKEFFKRPVQEEDVFSLYEWLDHMLSVSNNGAASVCWRETILMRAFGKDYETLTQAQADDYFKNTPKSELSELAVSIVNEPLRKLGITEDEWRLGQLFTRGGSSYIPGKGGSTGSPLGLMKFLVAMERGKVVDKESSLEIKRLMYMTDRRIRYGAAPQLTTAALFFKSGSLYKCRTEEGYSCGKYKGNIENFMNSVAIVEHQDGTKYMVVLMSNVLKKNSASDHQAIASSIDKIIRK